MGKINLAAVARFDRDSDDLLGPDGIRSHRELPGSVGLTVAQAVVLSTSQSRKEIVNAIAAVDEEKRDIDRLPLRVRVLYPESDTVAWTEDPPLRAELHNSPLNIGGAIEPQKLDIDRCQTITPRKCAGIAGQREQAMRPGDPSERTRHLTRESVIRRQRIDREG